MKFTEDVTIDSSRIVDPALYIRQLRIEQDKTLKELAELTQLNDGYISLLENNKRSMNEENFLKLMIVGLGVDETSAKGIWSEYIEQQNPDKKSAAKNLASRQYKVMTRGFETDQYYRQEIYVLTIRWVINGKIYLWRIAEDKYKTLNTRDPLISVTEPGQWSVILDLIGKDDTLLLFEVILDELGKEEAIHPGEQISINEARKEIQDLRDSVETLK